MEYKFLYKDEIVILNDWLQIQPHLPKIETEPLKRFLNTCDGDLENAKDLVKKHYEIRNNYKSFFIERDPSSHPTIQAWNIIDTIRLPGLTPEDDEVTLMRLCDYDISKFNFIEGTKLMMMLYDTFLYLPNPRGIPKEHILMCDMKGFSLSHFMKINIFRLRAFIKFYQEGLSMRVKNIHIINCTEAVNVILSIITPLVNSHVRNMIKCHLANSDTIFEYIPNEMFPSDYGGTSKSVKEMKEETWTQFYSSWSYLKNRKYWEIDESKRIKIKCGSWYNSIVKSLW